MFYKGGTPTTVSSVVAPLTIGLGAGGGNRTRTPLARPRILSPVRLPVPPPRHMIQRVELRDSTAFKGGWGRVAKTRRPVASLAFAFMTILGSGAACERHAAASLRKLTVTANDYTVYGEYRSVPLDRVDGLKVERGRLVVKGSPADLAVDVPPSADLERIARHWAL